MSDAFRLAVVAVCLFLAFNKGNIDLAKITDALHFSIPTAGQEEIVFPEPEPTLKAAVSPMIEYVKKGNAMNAMYLGNFHRDFATIVIGDPQFESAALIRETYTDALTRKFAALGLANGTYTGMAEWVAADKTGFIATQLGQDNAQWDAAKKQQAAKVFNALAWASYEAAKVAGK